MNLANIRLTDDHLVDPNLVPFIEKLALDNPSFIFNIKKSEYGWASHRCAMGRVEAPDGKSFVSRFDVKHAQTNEMLGRIGVKRKYRSRGPDDCVFFVQSWRIDNKRGDTNTSSTTKLAGALRIAKRALAPKIYDEIYHESFNNAHHAFAQAIHHIRSPIANGTLLPSRASIVTQTYLYQLLNGYEVDPEIETTMKETFTSDKYKAAVAEYNLGSKMENLRNTQRTIMVVEHTNGYIYSVPGEGLVCHSFEQLPDFIQNHVSVLQLMEDNEIVNDVGFRYQQGLYLVVTPE